MKMTNIPDEQSIPYQNIMLKGSTMKQVYFRKYPFVLPLFFSYIC